MVERPEHTEKMKAADADLDALAKARQQALKQIATADRKYKAYIKANR